MTRASYEVVALLKEKAGTNEFTPLPAAAPNGSCLFLIPNQSLLSLSIVALNAAANVSGSVFHIKGGNIGPYSEPEIKKTIDKEDGWWTRV